MSPGDRGPEKPIYFPETESPRGPDAANDRRSRLRGVISQGKRVVRKDDFVWLLAGLCQILNRPFDADLVLRAFPPPHDEQRLQAALAELGLRSRAATGLLAARGPMPCVAWLKPDSGIQGDAVQAVPDVSAVASGPVLVPVIVISADAERMLYLTPHTAKPVVATRAEFAAACMAGHVLVGREDDVGPHDDTRHPIARPAFGFGWFLPELLRHKGIWWQVLLASLAIQLVGLATPLFTQVIIDKVVVHQTESTLWVVGVALAMFMLFSVAMTWMRQYLVLHTGNRIDAVLGQQVFRHLLRLPLVYFESRPVGTLVARLQGIENIRQFLAGAAVTLLLDCPFLVIFLAVMFWYSWQLSLIALGALLLIALVSLAVTPLLRERLDHQFLQGARNQAFVTEFVSGMQTVKSLQMEPLLEDRYGENLARYLAAGFATRQIANTYGTVANGLEQAMTLAILVAGALLVMESANNAPAGGSLFTVGMLVAFQMFASRMSQPMLRLVGLWQEFQQARVSVRRLGDVMDMPAEHYSLAPQRSAESRQRGHVRLDGVSFRYSEAHAWLYRDLDLRFEPGELAVITGPSGCGKSTLAKLIQGFHPPSDGRILVDGADTRNMSVNDLRARFGVVPQETTLFSGSVHDNLLLACPGATFDEVVRACRQAGIHEVIEQLPQGYQTLLGERGVGLSGGQRQRISIARALLRSPAVLIFDEATSGLDAEAAALLAGTVNELRGSVTILFIAHVLPPGLQADRTVRLGRLGQAPR